MIKADPAPPKVTARSDSVTEAVEPRASRSWWRLIALLFGALVFLFPFYYMIIGSLQKTQNTSLSGVLPNPGNITLNNYAEINAAIGIGKAIINSGIFTGGVLLATLVFGILAGYALARLSFRGRGLLFALMLLVLTVPFQLLIIPLYVLIARNYGLANSYLGMIAPFAINSTAVFIFRQFFLNLPKELFDAARIDGATELRVLTRVALPLVRPAVLTAMLLTFIGPWNEFLWPLLITKQQSMQPLTVALANYISTVSGVATNPYGAIMAGAVVLAVPVVVLVIVFQRHFVSVNIGSAVSRIAPANSAVYTATKASVDAITGVLSKELGPKKIRVNSINPGVVETEGTQTAGIIGSDFEKGLVAQTPLGRTGQPGDIASVAVFLASENSAWLTGESIIAGGGLH